MFAFYMSGCFDFVTMYATHMNIVCIILDVQTERPANNSFHTSRRDGCIERESESNTLRIHRKPVKISLINLTPLKKLFVSLLTV